VDHTQQLSALSGSSSAAQHSHEVILRSEKDIRRLCCRVINRLSGSKVSKTQYAHLVVLGTKMAPALRLIEDLHGTVFCPAVNGFGAQRICQRR